jgi:hypothetical protein
MQSGISTKTKSTYSKSTPPPACALKPLQNTVLNCLIPKTELYPLSEIFQRYPSLFSFAERDGNNVLPLHTFVKCRDFLLDNLVWSRDPKSYVGPIYGFKPIPGTHYKKPQFALKNCLLYLEKNFHLLTDIENQLGLTASELHPMTGGYYVEGDAWWCTTTLHLSWYTTMLRYMGGMETLDLKKFSHVEPPFDYDVIPKLPFFFMETGYNELHPTKGKMNHDSNGIGNLLHMCKMLATELIRKYHNYPESLITLIKEYKHA